MALSFQIEVGHAQADGRRYVLEIHSDGIGEVWRREYLSRDTDDLTAIAAARAVVLEARLAEEEIESAIEEDRAPAMRFQTGAAFLARLRGLYRNGRAEKLARIARWIRRRIIAGDVTETQVQNAFGLTNPQWNALKSKMQALDEALQLVDEAEGE